jgi:hypothetical protein
LPALFTCHLCDEASIFFKASLIWCKRAAGARSSMKPLLVRPRASVSSIRACPWAWEVNSNSYWSDQAGLKPRGQDRPGQLASKKQGLPAAVPLHRQARQANHQTRTEPDDGRGPEGQGRSHGPSERLGERVASGVT